MTLNSLSVEELVDILGADGRVQATVTKTEAHARGLLHATVIAEVRDSADRLLLVRQSANRQDPGQLVSPVGGHVQSGESFEEALKREFLEEVGYEPEHFRLIGTTIYDRPVRNHRENHYFVLYEVESDAEPRLGDEAVDYRYFTPDELRLALNETPDHFGKPFFHLLHEFYPHLLPEASNKNFNQLGDVHE